MSTRICARCGQTYDDAPDGAANAARSYAPFCSKRCADVDLVHWLKGDYVIGGSGELAINDEDAGGAAPDSDTDEDV